MFTARDFQPFIVMYASHSKTWVSRQKRAGQKRADKSALGSNARRHKRAAWMDQRLYYHFALRLKQMKAIPTYTSHLHGTYFETSKETERFDHFRKEQDHVEIMIERYRAGFRQPEASKSKSTYNSTDSSSLSFPPTATYHCWTISAVSPITSQCERSKRNTH